MKTLRAEFTNARDLSLEQKLDTLDRLEGCNVILKLQLNGTLEQGGTIRGLLAGGIMGPVTKSRKVTRVVGPVYRLVFEFHRDDMDQAGMLRVEDVKQIHAVS